MLGVAVGQNVCIQRIGPNKFEYKGRLIHVIPAGMKLSPEEDKEWYGVTRTFFAVNERLVIAKDEFFGENDFICAKFALLGKHYTIILNFNVTAYPIHVSPELRYQE